MGKQNLFCAWISLPLLEEQPMIDYIAYLIDQTSNFKTQPMLFATNLQQEEEEPGMIDVHHHEEGEKVERIYLTFQH